MNRTLRRPMFRIGGSAGTGITSGLTMPRASYSEGTRLDKIKKIVTEDQAIMDELAPSRQSPLAPGTLSSFLIGTGLNLASATPRGRGLTGLVSTAAESAKGPFAQFQKGVFARDASDDQLKKSLVSRAIAKVDEDDKPEKIGTSKKVLDQDTGNIVFKPEKDIQTEMSTKKEGEMRYVPVPDTEKNKPKKVYDNQTKSIVFVNEADVVGTTFFNDKGKEVLRYVPVPPKDRTVRAYVLNEDTNEFGENAKFVKESLVLENPDLYKPVEGDIAMMLKAKDIEIDKANQKVADQQMLAANNVAKIIRRLEKDILVGRALTGNAGDTVQFITGVSGFVDSFVNMNKKDDMKAYKMGIKRVEDRVMQLQNDDSINARLTRFLNAEETAAAKSDVINLAYAIAKAREPGGRFSVTDIDLALQSIGESSNKRTFLKALKRVGLAMTTEALDNYVIAYNVTDENIPAKYNALINNNRYFRGLEISDDIKPGSLTF
jgi:hypothetical protein